MTEYWQEITHTVVGLPIISLTDIMAQNPPPPNQGPNVLQSLINGPVGQSLMNLAMAVVILVVGWLIATIIAAVIGRLLNSTSLDNKLATWITGRPSGAESPPVEKWITSGIFWIVMIFVLVAFFNQLNLTAVSTPLNSFLNQVTSFLPRLGLGLILLAGAWILATVSKMVVTRSLQALKVDEHLGQQVGGTRTTESNQLVISDTLANTLFWFILLLFLPSILETLGLQQALVPVQNLLDQILAALPKILKAVIIGATGWLLAQVVRRIVSNLLQATGTDRLGSQFGITGTNNTQSLSGLIGTVVYVLILIPTAIAALNALEIEAISTPAIGMLTQVLNVIPQVFTAGFILGVAYFIGRFVADLVTNILTGFGFNNLFYWLGLQSKPPAATQTTTSDVRDEQATVLQPSPESAKTPSEIVGLIAQIAIILFATVAATNILNIQALTAIVTGIVIVAGQILAGLIVFAIGLYLANLAFKLISSAGDRQARILAQTARIAIITLVSAMALQQMGIASNIVNLAFGLLLGAIAVAIAIAFGLGGRDIASEQIREWLDTFKQPKSPQ